MNRDDQRLRAGDAPNSSGVAPLAAWAGLPCSADRARRLQPLLEAQRQRMQRFYDEDVTGFEFDFLKPDEPGR